MRVALISYPMLFQRVGGLQVQVRDTLEGLRGLGVDARLFDSNSDRLNDFDIIHLFSVANGNHRVVEAARSAGVPVVVSPVLHPPWTAWDRRKAEWCERIVGRLTGWMVSTTYRQFATALQGADRIVALGPVEKTLIAEGYGVEAAKVAIVPNGIADPFFAADGTLFREAQGIAGPFVLSVASVSPYKNQLGLAKALRDVDVGVVLIGECAAAQQGYLQACRDILGARLVHVAPLAHDDPVLASSYAAATVFALPSQTEVAPISVMEALAAGTPVVLTRNNSLGLPGDAETLAEVDPADTGAIRAAVVRLLDKPAPAERCRAVVDGMTWTAVAQKLQAIYRDLA